MGGVKRILEEEQKDGSYGGLKIFCDLGVVLEMKKLGKNKKN